MGFNTTVLILNDGMDNILTDKDFPVKLHRQILKGEGDFSIGNHCNAGCVVDCHHADYTSLIAVGGNYGTVFAKSVAGHSHHSDEDKLAMLVSLATQMGYYIKKIKK